ncbi:MAG: hypothetical protein QXX94_07825 [Candidatus Bathyarchaeia archaeon]
MASESLAALIAALLLSVLVSLSQVQIIYDVLVNEYTSIFERMDNAFKSLMDDLASAMDLAEKFKDPNYNYDPKDLEEAINKDGHNGTRELLSVFEDLLNVTSKYLNVSIERP